MDNKSSFVGADLPKPWSIDVIEPEIRIYRSHSYQTDFTIKKGSTHDEVEEYLKQTHNQIQYTRIIFITHGFQDDIGAEWLSIMKDALLTQSQLSERKEGEHFSILVAVVGWGKGANLKLDQYLNAASNVENLGIWLAYYIQHINRILPSVDIWGIGHSLGAHLIGVAGRYSSSINRITGLDPSGPYFESHPNSNLLRRTDAKFVDVIHTDGAEHLSNNNSIAPLKYFGTLLPLGHMDFYPNFGCRQPGGHGGSSPGDSHMCVIQFFISSIAKMNMNKFLTYEKLDGTPKINDPVYILKRVETPAAMGFYCTLVGSETDVNCFFIVIDFANKPMFIGPGDK